MKYWICFEHGRPTSPWVTRPEFSAKPEARRGSFSTYTQAQRRVKRLRRMWQIWQMFETLRRMPPNEPFTEQQYAKVYEQVQRERRVRETVRDIFRVARECGIDPKDIIEIEGSGSNQILRAGKLLREHSLPKLSKKLRRPAVVIVPETPPAGLQPGQRYRPKDTRRKTEFVVSRVEGNVVFGEDGRTIRIERMQRYQFLGA